MSAHNCDAIVVCCIDFRFQKFIREWTDKNLSDKTFDLVGFAGSTKNLETVMAQIEISVRLHHIKEVVLIHHEECGAYGTESTKARHVKDLKKAKSEVNSVFPKVTVRLYYLSLNGSFEEVI